MRTYDAIEVIGQKVINRGLCEAILLKGSIGRGDDDEFSDVDMYLVVKDENVDDVMKEREDYLAAYREIVYLADTNFGLPQNIAIYDDGLHVDLYVATAEQLVHSDPIKVHYDPNGLFKDYTWSRDDVSMDEIANFFEEALGFFPEANIAYQRKNYAWTARIIDQIVSETAILLRYHYDKQFAFLGLKKINQIIPQEQYLLLENAYANLENGKFQKANQCIIDAFEIFLDSASDELKEKLNLKLYNWIKVSLNTILF